jgi:hypothetical protein
MTANRRLRLVVALAALRGRAQGAALRGGRGRERGLQPWLPSQTCYWSNGTEAANCAGFHGPCQGSPGYYADFAEALSGAQGYCGTAYGEAYTVWMAEGMRDPWTFECCGAETEAGAELAPEPRRELQQQWLPDQSCYWSDGTEAASCAEFHDPCSTAQGGFTGLWGALSAAYDFCAEEMGVPYTVWRANETTDPWKYGCCGPAEAEAEPAPEPHRELQQQWLPERSCYWSNGTEAASCAGFYGTCGGDSGYAGFWEALSNAYEFCGEIMGVAYTVWNANEMMDPWKYACCSPTETAAAPEPHRELQQLLPNQTCYWSNGDEVPHCSGFVGSPVGSPGFNFNCQGIVYPDDSMQDVYEETKFQCGYSNANAFTVWLGESPDGLPWKGQCCFLHTYSDDETVAPEPRRELQQQWLPNQSCYWSNGTEAVSCTGFHGTCGGASKGYAGFWEALSDAYEFCGEIVGVAYTVWNANEMMDPWKYVCCSPNETAAAPESHRELQQLLPNQTCYLSNGDEVLNCSGFPGSPRVHFHCRGDEFAGSSVQGACNLGKFLCGVESNAAFTVWLGESVPGRPWQGQCCFRTYDDDDDTVAAAMGEAGTETGGAGSTASARVEPDRDHGTPPGPERRGLQGGLRPRPNALRRTSIT